MRIDDDLPRILTTTEARRRGITRSAQRHASAERGWQRLGRGIYLTTPTPPTRTDWILAGLASAGPRAALSGWDAVRLQGLGSATPPTPFVLILDREGNHRTIGGARVRPTERAYSSQMLPGDHPTLPYVPVVATARAVADTALSTRTLTPVRALVTAAVQRGVCLPEQLLAELDACPRAESHWLRVATQDVLDGARSIAEAEAGERLRAARLPHCELNVPIVDSTGHVIAVADVLWRALRAVLEIDSREFHFTENDWKATMRRHNLLTACGLAVRHDPPSEIRSAGTAWSSSVRGWLRHRAAELGVAFTIADDHEVRTGPAVSEPFMVHPPI